MARTRGPTTLLALLCGALTLLLVPGAGLAAGDCLPAAEWPAADGALAGEVVALVNEHRASLGLESLAHSGSLAASAVWKARHMAEYRYMQHADPAPPVARSVGERLAACAYSGRAWGENIAYGYPTAQAVVAAWLASSGHRANIENPTFTAIGVGAAPSAGGTLYWAQNFGLADVQSPPSQPQPAPGQDADPPSTPDPTPAKEAWPPVAAPAEQPPEGPAATPPPTEDEPPHTPAEAPQAEAGPSALRIRAGRVTSGAAPSLRAADSRRLVVRSRRGRTAWTVAVGSLPADATSLRVAYRGSTTRSCLRAIALFELARGAWVVVDARRVGVEDRGTVLRVEEARRFVAAGSGRVRVRVTCARAAKAPFSTRADLLRVVAASA